MISRLSTEKYVNNMRRKFPVSEQSSWRPVKAQLACLPISASMLVPALQVFLPPLLDPPYHTQILSWEGLRVTPHLTVVTVKEREIVTEKGRGTEASSKESVSAIGNANASARSGIASVRENEIANNESPKRSRQTESRRIDLNISVHP
jgi:hypothetical protein